MNSSPFPWPVYDMRTCTSNVGSPHTKNKPTRLAVVLSGHVDSLPLAFKMSLSKFPSGGGSFGIVIP